MKRTNKEVAQCFVRGVDAEGSNFYSRGGVLVSYSTIVAEHYGSFILVTNDGWTPTTKKQLSGVYGGAVPIIRAGCFVYGRALKRPSVDAIIFALEYELSGLNLNRKEGRYRASVIEQDLVFLRQEVRL